MPPSFENWLPSTATTLNDVVANNCSVPLQTFQNNTDQDFRHAQSLCRAVFNCVMENVDETSAYLYQSAGVLLGLTPTALSLIGNTTAEISLLSSACPVLALFIALAAPTIAPFPSLRYQNPLESLKLHQDRTPYPRLRNPATRNLICAVQYLIVIAAAANVAHLAYQLSTLSVFVPSCVATFNPFLWTYLAPFIHLVGVIAFDVRVRIRRQGYRPNTVRGWLSNETKLCVAHSGIVYELRHQSAWSLFLNWLLATLTSVHLVYGTLVLSSSTFIDVTDAVLIIARYLLSTGMARIVLMFEIYGLDAAINDPRTVSLAAAPMQRVALGDQEPLINAEK